VEYQATHGEIINALISAGLAVQYVAEYAEPFWRPDGLERPAGLMIDLKLAFAEAATCEEWLAPITGA
jgi:hypothetical protein